MTKQPKGVLSTGVLGSICVFLVVFSWVSLALISQWIQQGANSEPYDKPYFQTYFLHSGYMVTLAIWYLMTRNNPSAPNPITPRFLSVTLFFSLLSFVSGYLYYVSIPITPVSANTAIYQSSCVFIFLFSIPILHETPTLPKILSVLICVLGVFIVIFSDSAPQEGPSSTSLGYLFVIGSTIVYSLTETLYGKIVRGDGTTDNIDAAFSFLFLGFIGLHTFLFYWPGLFLLHYLGIETFLFPTGAALLGQVVLLVLDTLFNAAFFVGIFYSSPLFMSVGSILTVPCSALLDKVLNDYQLSPFGLSGILAIALGFLGLNLAEYATSQQHPKKEISKKES